MQLNGDLLSFHRYMSVERHLSERTATEYCRDIDRFTKWLKRDGKTLNDVKVKHIRRWIILPLPVYVRCRRHGAPKHPATPLQ